MAVIAENRLRPAPVRGQGRCGSANWWRGAVLYQIYPRSFFDSNGDGIGDLPGILQKLDYIAELGVDGIWISPFFTSPMRDFGYDVSDHRGVDPSFGNLADFDAIVRRAHELGLKVIIDQIYSHTSDQHPWFLQSRSGRAGAHADWYVWASPKPDGAPPNNWQSVFYGPAWSWNTTRRQYYLHNFLPQQPDLNLHCPQVQDAIADIMRFWLDRGVDGLRLDAVPFYLHDPLLRDNPAADGAAGNRPRDYQRHQYNFGRPETELFLQRLRSVLDEYADRFAVAEIGGRESFDLMARYADGQDGLHTAYNFFFLDSPELSAGLFKDAVQTWAAIGKQSWPAWAFSNHDCPRVLSRWGGAAGSQPLAQLLNVLLLSLRGTLFLYQGEELGLGQADVPVSRLRDPEAILNWPATLGRDGARTPMPWGGNAMHCGFSAEEPWLPIDPRHVDLAVDRQRADPDSTLSKTKAFLHFRKRHPALVCGDIEWLDAPDCVVAFLRTDATEQLLCAFNLSGEPVDWDISGSGPWKMLAVSGMHPLLAPATVTIAPYGLLIARSERGNDFGRRLDLP